jgi:hypothetical protein
MGFLQFYIMSTKQMVLEEMYIVTKDDYHSDRKKMELGDRWIKIACYLFSMVFLFARLPMFFRR